MSSNDYRQVRGYIKSVILANYPQLEEWKGSLSEIGNIPNTLLDKSYHITIQGSSVTSKISQHIEEDVSVLLNIFKRGYNDQVDVRDDLLELANCIRLDLITPMEIENYKFANDGNIEDVLSNSITPSEIDFSNDNIIKVEIGLTVRLFFGL